MKNSVRIVFVLLVAVCLFQPTLAYCGDDGTEFIGKWTSNPGTQDVGADIKHQGDLFVVSLPWFVGGVGLVGTYKNGNLTLGGDMTMVIKYNKERDSISSDMFGEMKRIR
jgi:hypothetical protein